MERPHRYTKLSQWKNLTERAEKILQVIIALLKAYLIEKKKSYRINISFRSQHRKKCLETASVLLKAFAFLKKLNY